MAGNSFFADLLQTIADRGRLLLDRVRGGAMADVGLAELCETLLSSRGEASGVALASAILERWRSLDEAGRRQFLVELRERFGPDYARIDRAVAVYEKQRDARSVVALHEAAEPRRQELIRRLNLAPGGVRSLVRMRAELLRQQASVPGLEVVDADFEHLLASWFNRGFLVLRRIDWSTPANILEKIIAHEAVHEIGDWGDLRERLQPGDRRCFAFFHPRLNDDPLIFVEVALTRTMPAAIGELLGEDRERVPAEEATTAVFYSISNCEEGLRGISFGSFLLKQVIEDLRQELPRVTEFVTLSPVPGFAAWLAGERAERNSAVLTQQDRTALAALDRDGWTEDPAAVETLRESLLALAAHYFLRARTAAGRPIDAVARFHLGNGARLERLDFLGDVSEKAMRQAHGLMVNYRYKLDDIEKNHESFAAQGEIVAAPAVKRLLREERPGRPAKDAELAAMGKA
jgi:malonyl-CoA decarboxylase